MNAVTPPDASPMQAFSPLVLMDRLISLARDADRAGHAWAAAELVELAHAVCDGPPARAAH